jgi:hypothetical protein
MENMNDFLVKYAKTKGIKVGVNAFVWSHNDMMDFAQKYFEQKVDQNTISNTDEKLAHERLLGDVFASALLKTLNSVYEKFTMLERVGNIYVIGYDKESYTGTIPKKGGDLAIAYPETDIVIVDRDCVIPFTRQDMERQGGWKDQFDDVEWMKGHTAGCLIFSDIIKDKRKRGVI